MEAGAAAPCEATVARTVDEAAIVVVRAADEAKANGEDEDEDKVETETETTEAAAAAEVRPADVEKVEIAEVTVGAADATEEEVEAATEGISPGRSLQMS